MKNILTVILIQCLVFIQVAAQGNLPAGVDIEKLKNMEDVRPEDIPSEATLRLMGVPEAQIRKAMEYKEGNKTFEQLKQELNGGVQENETPSNQNSPQVAPPKQNQDGNKPKTNEPATPKVDLSDIFQVNDISRGGKKITTKVFGQDFFRNSNIELYQTTSLAKAPDNYILGAEDIISISVWGYSEYDGEFVISQDGYISPKELGRIYLKGLSFGEAKSLVRRRFARYLDLKNSQIAISLTYSRVVKVNIVGEVLRPGSYSIAAINSAFNALIAAGGPNDIGSLRNIYIKRDGRTVKTIDIYEFLLNPNSREEYFLQENDYLFVPQVEKLINIGGEVQKPFGYELKEGENLNALLDFAGGFKSTAITKNLQLQRFADGDQVLLDIAYDSLANIRGDYKLLDGDTIFVYKIPGVINKFVEVFGSIKLPGKYEFADGMRVADLIGTAGGLLDGTYYERAYLVRLNSDLTRQYVSVDINAIMKDESSDANVKLQNRDKLRLFSKEEFSDFYTVSISGAVRKEGQYIYGEQMTLKDLLYFAGGLRPEAANNRIEISRIINFDESVKEAVPSRTVIEIIEIGMDLSIDFRSESFKMQPYDFVFVRETPDFNLQENVRISGEVQYPGLYSLESRSDRLTMLIERAGGFTNEAFLNGMKLYRAEDKTGFVFVDYEKANKKFESRYNYIMEDGDEIFIPKLNQLVRLKGAINYPGLDTLAQINTPYLAGKRAKYYIKGYGAGFKRKAKKRKTYVELSNGYVRTTRNYGLFKVYPKVDEGSTIFVEMKKAKQKQKPERPPKSPEQVNAIVMSVATSITSALTLYILLRNLNQ